MKIARHRGMKKAIVALARRLAVIMHRIWVDGTEFQWTRSTALSQWLFSALAEAELPVAVSRPGTCKRY